MTTDTRIRRFAKPGVGSVNSFAIVVAEGVILIDGQRELSSARAALSSLNPEGKPIVAVFLTHPHPDHFGGIGVFVDAGNNCPLYASRQTRDSIAEDRMGLIGKSRESVGDDFPEVVTLPDHVLARNETLRIADLEIATPEMGAGEAECMTVVYLPASGDLFAGDVVQHRMTAFLLEGRIDAWLDQVEALRREFPQMKVLHPGHGESGTPDELLAYQRDYLDSFKSFVAAEVAGEALKPGGAERVTSRMQAKYPGFEPVAAIPDLLTQDVEPVAAAIVARTGSMAPSSAG